MRKVVKDTVNAVHFVMIRFTRWSMSCFQVSTVTSTTSVVLIARIITGHAKVLFPSVIPVDLKSGTTVKYCHTLPSRPFFANSSRRIASDSRTASSLARVIESGASYAEAGAREGLTVNHVLGKAQFFTYHAYFVFEEQLYGSTSSKWEAMSSGRPPTLWCAFIPSSLSRMSG